MESKNPMFTALKWCIDLMAFMGGTLIIGCCGNFITCGYYSLFYNVFMLMFAAYSIVQVVVFASNKELTKREVKQYMAGQLIKPVEVFIGGMIIGRNSEGRISIFLILATVITAISAVVTCLLGAERLGKNKFSKGGGAKVRKAEQRVQKIQEKGFEKDLKNAKTLSEVRMIETEMVKNDITNERDTTSHVAALEDMRKQLEDGTNGQE